MCTHEHPVVCVITTVCRRSSLSALNVCLLQMYFCLYVCKGNLRHIHRYRVDSIHWMLRFIDTQILISFMSVSCVNTSWYCTCWESVNSLKSACERTSFQVCILGNFSFLNSWYSILTQFSGLESSTSCLSRRENRYLRIESRLSTYLSLVLLKYRSNVSWHSILDPRENRVKNRDSILHTWFSWDSPKRNILDYAYSIRLSRKR